VEKSKNVESEEKSRITVCTLQVLECPILTCSERDVSREPTVKPCHDFYSLGQVLESH
jgi:hypothetical protein